MGKKFRRKEYSSGIFGDEAGVQRDNRATELQMNEINKIKWSEDYSSFLFFSLVFRPRNKSFSSAVERDQFIHRALRPLHFPGILENWCAPLATFYFSSPSFFSVSDLLAGGSLTPVSLTAIMLVCSRYLDDKREFIPVRRRIGG